MKKLALLLLAAGLLFASCCYESLDDTAEYDIQVDNLFVSSMRSAISKNLGNNTSLSINIQFTGGYNDSKWKDVTLATLSGTIITFDSVPLGKTFDIWVGVYYGSELLYEASQKSIRLTSDTTELSLILKKLLNTQYVLYNYNSQNGYQYYLKDSPDASVIETSNMTASSNSFCFDTEGNFYYIDGPNIHSDRNDFTNDGVPIGIEPVSQFKINVDFAENVMYVARFTGDNVFYLYKYPNLVSSLDPENNIEYQISGTSFTFSNETSIAVYNGVLYTVGSTDNDDHNPHLVKANLSSAGVVSVTDLVNLGKYVTMSPNGTVTDMLYQDGAIYILGKDFLDSTSSSASPWYYYSRGVLLKYDIASEKMYSLGFSNNKLSNSGKYAYLNRATGADGISNAPYYADFERTTLLLARSSDLIVNNDSADTLCIYAPSSANSGFYGPSKFIAIKPKKLVIADDGIAFYTDSLGAYRYKNVNRIVTVDLESFVISGYDMVSSGVKFKEELSGFLPNSCKYQSLKGGFSLYTYSDGNYTEFSGGTVYYGTSGNDNDNDTKASSYSYMSHIIPNGD
ncbi:hypothetical protein [Treponema sp. C6A8]|uniref:hypothetical protein n=1 Tax=Treponema sp. C6A8 TaxID=1410609 RepID=UPI0012DE7CAB|nr:hypothetical protein [Treponema sp. C6A8]